MTATFWPVSGWKRRIEEHMIEQRLGAIGRGIGQNDSIVVLEKPLAIRYAIAFILVFSVAKAEQASASISMPVMLTGRERARQDKGQRRPRPRTQLQNTAPSLPRAGTASCRQQHAESCPARNPLGGLGNSTNPPTEKGVERDGLRSRRFRLSPRIWFSLARAKTRLARVQAHRRAP